MTIVVLNNPMYTFNEDSKITKIDIKRRVTLPDVRTQNLLIQDIPEKIRRKLKTNNIRRSYGNRFLRSKRRILLYKTVIQNYLKVLSSGAIIKMYLSYVEKNMPKIEKRERYKRSLNGLFANFVSMSYRFASFTKVFVTHCVKNTFVTIFRGKKRNNNYNKIPVIAKVSSGLIGFQGPKKSTVFARKAVIKEAGNILAGKMTSLLDVIFTSKVSRWNRKAVRDLCPNLSYILNIHINYNRSHGYKKLKTRRRT